MDRLRKLLERASMWCFLNQYLIASIICFLIAGVLVSIMLAIN
jgi:hypothetical protein